LYAELKALSSTDEDMENFVPDNDHCFGFWCQAVFGKRGEDGGDMFHFFVCTPEWLALEIREGRRLNASFGRGLLIVGKYNYSGLVVLLRRHAERCSGDTWLEVSNKLMRTGASEFEDYQPNSSR
jgi:hypothetical protein